MSSSIRAEFYTSEACRKLRLRDVAISRRAAETPRTRVEQYTAALVETNRELSATMAVLSFCEGDYRIDKQSSETK